MPRALPLSHSKPSRNHKKSNRHSLSRINVQLTRSALPTPPTEPQTPSLFRRMSFSRQKIGSLILILLLSLYLSGYISLASSEPNHDQNADKSNLQEVIRVANPTKPYLLQPQVESNGNKLPGAVSDDSKKFEGDDDEKKNQRDLNKIPGAIGLDGAFDENKVDMFQIESTNSTKDENGAKTLESSKKESDGEKKKKKKKKKRKRRKKKRASDEKSEDGESKSEKTKDKESDDKNQPKVGNDKGKKDDGEAKESKKSELSAEEKSKSEGASSEDSKKKSGEGDSGEKSTKDNSKKEPEKIQQSRGPLFHGPHPMNRQMEELQVPSEGVELNDESVKQYYEKLVKAYLAPFAEGIPRSSFFEILKRRTYSMAPPGSNKGVQTLLFQLIEKKLFLLDPYDIMKNSKPFYKTRLNELIWLLSDIAKSGVVPNTEFLVAIHDCVQTVNQDHEYRASIYKESSPTFTIVSCNFSDNIPFPMWEGDPVRGGLKSWDEKMEKYRAMDVIPWEKKEAKAVFRGGNRPSMFFKTKKDANDHCDHSGRTAIAYLAEKHPDLFDVGVSGMCGGKTYRMEHLSESGHHGFKYIMYAEGNCFWADRLNKQIFGPSAIIKQETPCGQFWEPLLKPMTHYIPTDFFFSDTMDRIKWAKENDEKVMEMVKKANDFASAFLSFKGIKAYVEVLLIEYTKLLKTSSITPEKGSVEVTV